MFDSYFKKLIRKVLNEDRTDVPTPTTEAMRNQLLDSSPSIVAFRISNGYVVRVHNPHDYKLGTIGPGFTYCKDAQAIAEHIVASAMKDKLGVQSDMFEQEKQAALRTQTANAALRGVSIRKTNHV
jgi:hypothetical protein